LHGFYHFNACMDRFAQLTTHNSARRSHVTVSLLNNLHFQARLIERVCDESYFYFLPFLLFFGGSIFVSTSFGTIRLHDVIPMPFYLGLPCLSVTVFTVVLAMFPAATAVHDQSCRLLRHMTAQVSPNGYLARQVKSQRPFRFSFGSLFIAKNSTKTTFMQVVFDRIVDCLLLYE